MSDFRQFHLSKVFQTESNDLGRYKVEGHSSDWFDCAVSIYKFKLSIMQRRLSSKTGWKPLRLFLKSLSLLFCVAYSLNIYDHSRSFYQIMYLMRLRLMKLHLPSEAHIIYCNQRTWLFLRNVPSNAARVVRRSKKIQTKNWACLAPICCHHRKNDPIGINTTMLANWPLGIVLTAELAIGESWASALHMIQISSHWLPPSPSFPICAIWR